jgi:hypothetical protein
MRSIQKTGIYSTLSEATIGLMYVTYSMSNHCPAQSAANRNFIKNIYDGMKVSIAQVNHFMHSVSNIENFFCSAYDSRVPDVKPDMHKLK